MDENWRFIKEVHSLKDLPNDTIPEFVFWGRSNVGKSSLINLLTKKKIAKTSKSPGLTKSLVLFQFKNNLRILDFPGYGFSRIPKRKEFSLDTLINKYLSQRKNLKELFLLVDSRLGFKEIDIKILENLSDINIQTCIVFTKIDKLKTKKEKEKIKSYIDKVQNQHYKKIFNTSIHQSNGIILLKKFLFKSL
tara:strand:+ start:60 stop:635 length:576 start_codon:yes stop_codon:yes gene_type:complete